MGAWVRNIGCALLLAGLALPAVADVAVKGVRMWPAPDNTRLVFDLSAPVEHTIFTLRSPDRLVIDLKQARYPAGRLPKLAYEKSFIRQIRHGRRQDRVLRFVLDLRHPVRPKSFVLRPQGNYGHRLVIDLYPADASGHKPKPKPVPHRPKRGRDVIIAIDAGHGGEDPGAIGPRGTREKDVVLGIARRLADLVRREPGMKPVLIRTGDYYVSLGKRVEKASRADADLFVSIHADAFRNRRARGSSVFVLSNRGATSAMAAFLAESENRSDLIGGVNFNDKDDLLRMVLVDMVKNSTLEDSHKVASSVLANLGRVTRLHKRTVEQAGFRVLKSTNIPSILVETAFISNPEEERKLRSARHQQALARAIMNGIRRYFRENPPPNTRLALQQTPRKHVITRGETLSGIAARYRVSVRALRRHNGLRSDRIKPGDVIRIPYS